MGTFRQVGVVAYQRHQNVMGVLGLIFGLRLHKIQACPQVSSVCLKRILLQGQHFLTRTNTVGIVRLLPLLIKVILHLT